MRVSTLVMVALALSACKKKPTEPVVPETLVQPELATTDSPVADLVGVPTAIVETKEQRVARVMAQSVETLRDGDPTQARQVIEDLKALGADAPTAAEIPFDIGVAYELLGDETNARKSYLRATDIDPTLGSAWLNIGALAENRGEFDRALQSYQTGLRYDPDNAELVVGVVSALRRQGRYVQAINKAKKALGQNANNIEIYNNLGLIYLAQGQTDLASFVCQKALNSVEGADANANLHGNLGKVFLARGESYNARQELERALDLDPKLISAMTALAQLHMDDHNWTEAAALLERAKEDKPDDAAILTNLGICYRGLGRYEESQKLYERALVLAPRNPDPYLNLAVLQGDYLREYDAALASIDRYLAAGGEKVTLAEEWREDLTDAKSKYEKELVRKQKREERAAKRAEEERLAAEYEASQQALRDAADAALGKACPDVGCPEFTACSRENVCASDGDPGTTPQGGACESDLDCGYDLVCGSEATCTVADPGSPQPDSVLPQAIPSASPGTSTPVSEPVSEPTPDPWAEPSPQQPSPQPAPSPGDQ